MTNRIVHWFRDLPLPLRITLRVSLQTIIVFLSLSFFSLLFHQSIPLLVRIMLSLFSMPIWLYKAIIRIDTCDVNKEGENEIKSSLP